MCIQSPVLGFYLSRCGDLRLQIFLMFNLSCILWVSICNTFKTFSSKCFVISTQFSLWQGIFRSVLLSFEVIGHLLVMCFIIEVKFNSTRVRECVFWMFSIIWKLLGFAFSFSIWPVLAEVLCALERMRWSYSWTQGSGPVSSSRLSPVLFGPFTSLLIVSD